MAYVRNGPSVYRTEDGQLVLEGDPNAAYLVVANGSQLSDDIARAYGLVDAAGRPVEPDEQHESDDPENEGDQEVSEALAKQQKEPHVNKQRPAPANKSGS